ncbi:MAG: class I SAM-dependent methyltransferase [Bacteroidota bacterium]
MSVYTTEITSDQIPSDNPIHQRLLSAYHFAQEYIKGDLLELGCGEGRGVELLVPRADSYLGIDKIDSIVQDLKHRFPSYKFMQGTFPPFPFKDNQFDCLVTFQVIEHVEEDLEFIKEIHRVLKPGGKALMTTPNIKMTLSRNPWHIREYTAAELTQLCEKVFSKVEMMGVAGNEKVLAYHKQNRASVNKIMKYDIFNLQHRLPASLLRKPYEVLNRINRKKLKNAEDSLALEIGWNDFKLVAQHEQNLDLFCFLTK